MSEPTWRDCDLCHIPIASKGCTHVERLGERVVMSADEHERLVAELADLRNREPEPAV